MGTLVPVTTPSGPATPHNVQYGKKEAMSNDSHEAVTTEAAVTVSTAYPPIAIIKVATGPDGFAWLIVERVPNGWQSGEHHYPDGDVLEMHALAGPGVTFIYEKAVSS